MIVVTTPTGQIGCQVLDRLLAAGTDPGDRPRPGPPVGRVRAQAEVVQGSHADPDVRRRAWAPTGVLAGAADARGRQCRGPLPRLHRATVRGDRRPGFRRVVGVSTLGRRVAKNAGRSRRRWPRTRRSRPGGALPGAVPAVPDGESAGPGRCDARCWARSSWPLEEDVVSTQPARPATSPPRRPDCSWTTPGRDRRTSPLVGPDDLSPYGHGPGHLRSPAATRYAYNGKTRQRGLQGDHAALRRERSLGTGPRRHGRGSERGRLRGRAPHRVSGPDWLPPVVRGGAQAGLPGLSTRAAHLLRAATAGRRTDAGSRPAARRGQCTAAGRCGGPSRPRTARRPPGVGPRPGCPVGTRTSTVSVSPSRRHPPRLDRRASRAPPSPGQAAAGERGDANRR